MIPTKDRAVVLSTVAMIESVVVMALYPLIGFLSDQSVDFALAFLGVMTLVFAIVVRTDVKHLKT